jgi:hypothetical protein
MSREFVQERLFKPFDTTKGSKGMGIGAYQVREYIQSLGGRVEVRSAPGKGTVITLRLPLSAPPSEAPPPDPVRARVAAEVAATAGPADNGARPAALTGAAP